MGPLLHTLKAEHANCGHLAPSLPHAAVACAADAAIREIARVAEEVNTSVDNIGARRLHTILERILEDVSYEAPEKVSV